MSSEDNKMTDQTVSGEQAEPSDVSTVTGSTQASQPQQDNHEETTGQSVSSSSDPATEDKNPEPVVKEEPEASPPPLPSSPATVAVGDIKKENVKEEAQEQVDSPSDFAASDDTQVCGDQVINEDAALCDAGEQASVPLNVTQAPLLQPPQKRGPGRPRKDGQSPIPRKRSMKIKIITKKSATGVTEFTGTCAEAGQRFDDTPTSEVITTTTALSYPLQEGNSMDSCSSTQQDSCKEESMTSSCEDIPHNLSGESTTSTPHVERTMSEESTFSEGTIGRLCSFCNCGEKSLLGQGELSRYDPTAGFNPFRKSSGKGRRGSLEQEERGDKSPKHLAWRRSRPPARPGRERSKSPRRPTGHSTEDEDGRPVQIVDELSTVGFSEDLDPAVLFEETGHVWAHHCCAAWSEGVIQTEDYTLHYADKAVYQGFGQKCSYCQRMGATIVCRFPKCAKTYHYPCASGGGCFQDIKTLSLLCPEHTDQAEAIAGQEALCVVCDAPGEISEQLFCTSCGQHYHGNCLDPPVEVNPVVRAGWQCPECKICQTCRQPGDDNKMLVCDTCDKGYHTFCLKPVMTSIPKNGWKCKNCRSCSDCGSRTPGSGPSSRWHLNYSVCDSCYQQRNKGLSCPICGKAYRHLTQKLMVQCSLCKKYVHNDCERALDAGVQIPKEGENVTDYQCLLCRNRDATQSEQGGLTESLNMMIDEANLTDIENFNIFKEGDSSSTKEEGTAAEEGMQTSQDSMLLNEDSISSMDIDLNMLEKGMQVVTQSLAMPQQPALLNNPMPDIPTVPALPTPAGLGKGKPPMGKNLKKISGRPRGRTVGLGKKRQRSLSHSGDVKRRGPKPKIKAVPGPAVTQPNGQVASSVEQSSDKDDHHSTVVLCSSEDQFVLNQDMCMSCGSFGRADEGKLIVCTQCGQCYHPYCVNIKVNKIVLQKGWRCLDCTVCEGCGKPHDEGRLILCDECDISYHIYCLEPPLKQVPKGTWKCKWCALCHTCGATTPGFNCKWKNNYGQCGPCHSLATCPICKSGYHKEELIIQCTQCDRWMHTLCDGIRNEEEAEWASDFGYHCLFCRPFTGVPGPLPPLPPPPPPEPVREPTPPPPSPPPPPPKEPEPVKPKPLFMDGMCLSESGYQQIKSQIIKMPPIKRPRKPKHSETLRHPHMARLLNISGEKMDVPADEEEAKLLGKDSPMYVDESTLSGSVTGELDTFMSPGQEFDKPAEDMAAPLEKKKRPRKAYRIGLGVGGFIARARNRGGMVKRSVGTLLARQGVPGTLPGGQVPGSPSKADNEEIDKATEEVNETLGTQGDKPKRRRRVKKKGVIEDSFPAYLQEAFFGKSLLDSSKEPGQVKLDAPFPETEEEKQDSSLMFSPQKTLETKDIFQSLPTPTPASTVEPEPPPKTSTEVSAEPQIPATTQQQQLSAADQQSDQEMHNIDGDILPSDLLPSDLLEDDLAHDEDLMGILGDELSKDTTDQHAEGEANRSTGGTKDSITDNVNFEKLLCSNLDVEKNIDIDKMLKEGLAQIDSKTVEDLFKGVLSSDTAPGTSPGPGSEQSFTMPNASLPAPGPGTQQQQHLALQGHLVSLQAAAAASQQQGFTSNTALTASHMQAASQAVMGAGQSQLTAHPSTQGIPRPVHPSMPGQSPGSLQTSPGVAGMQGMVQGMPRQAGMMSGQGSVPCVETAGLQQGPQTPGALSPYDLPMASPFPAEFSSNPQSNLGFAEQPATPAPTGQWPPQTEEAETEGLSYNKRNILKWEKDEPLGEKATISPVLYCNMAHPELKTDYPEWSERAKQIMKLWRRVPTDQRAPYLAKARENRANYRLSQGKKPSRYRPKNPPAAAATVAPAVSTLLGKNSQEASPAMPPPPPPPPPGPKRSVTPDKTQKEQKQLEQERQWKILQQMRQQQKEQQLALAAAQNAPGLNSEIQGVAKTGAPGESPVTSTDTPPSDWKPDSDDSNSQGKLVMSTGHDSTAEGMRAAKSLENDPYAFPPLTPTTAPPQTLSRSHETFNQAAPPASLPQSVVTGNPPVSPVYDSTPSSSSTSPRGQADQFGPHPAVSRPPDMFTRPQMSRQDSFGLGAVRPQPEGYGHSPTASVPGGPPGGPPLRPHHPFSPHQLSPQHQQPLTPTDPYSHPPSTPRPPALPQEDPYGQHVQPPGIHPPPSPGQFPQQGPGPVRGPRMIPFPSPGPRMADPFGGHTPRNAVTADMLGKQTSPPDPFAHQPPTPRKQHPADIYGRAMTSDPYSQPPATPQPMSQESAISPDIHQIISSTRQRFMDERPGEMAGPDQAMLHRSYWQSPYHGYRKWPYMSRCLFGSEAENAKHEAQRQQVAVRELLAKQMKQRQNKKKLEEQERIIRERSNMPLRHWPDDENQQQFSNIPTGYPFGETEQRPPPPGYPVQFSPRGPPAGGMERWHEQQGMIRPPHPSQVRPDMDMFGPPGTPHGDMRGGFPGPVRGHRLLSPQQGAYPGPPGGPGGSFPGARYPQRHPSQYMDVKQQQEPSPAERHRTPYLQMFQERLRRAQQQQQQPPPPLPGPGPGPRLPPSAGAANNPLDPYDHMVRGQPPRYPHPAGDMNPAAHAYSPGELPGSRPLSHSSSPGTTPFSTPPTTPQSSSVYPPLPPGAVGMQATGQQPGYPMAAGSDQAFSHGHNVTQNVNAAQPAAVMDSSKVEVELPQAALHGTGTPTQNAPPPHEEIFDDLLGADGTFNLLEYADPELDDTLVEEHDKSMFDEHLGIASECSDGKNSANPKASMSAKSQQQQQQLLQQTQHQQQQHPGLQQQASNQTFKTPSPVSQNKPLTIAGVDGTQKAIKSEFPSPANASVKPNTSPHNKTSPPSAGENSQSPTEAHKPKPADFQSQFLEFSRRRSATIEEENVDENNKAGHREAAGLASGHSVEVKSDQQVGSSADSQQKASTDKIEQMDGCSDERFPAAESLSTEDQEVSDILHKENEAVRTRNRIIISCPQEGGASDEECFDESDFEDILCLDGCTDDKPAGKDDSDSANKSADQLTTTPGGETASNQPEPSAQTIVPEVNNEDKETMSSVEDASQASTVSVKDSAFVSENSSDTMIAAEEPVSSSGPAPPSGVAQEKSGGTENTNTSTLPPQCLPVSSDVNTANQPELHTSVASGSMASTTANTCTTAISQPVQPTAPPATTPDTRTEVESPQHRMTSGHPGTPVQADAPSTPLQHPVPSPFSQPHTPSPRVASQGAALSPHPVSRSVTPQMSPRGPQTPGGTPTMPGPTTGHQTSSSAPVMGGQNAITQMTAMQTQSQSQLPSPRASPVSTPSLTSPRPGSVGGMSTASFVPTSLQSQSDAASSPQMTGMPVDAQAMLSQLASLSQMSRTADGLPHGMPPRGMSMQPGMGMRQTAPPVSQHFAMPQHIRNQLAMIQHQRQQQQFAAHQGMPAGHQGMPAGHQGMPAGHQGMPVGHQGMPTGHQGMMIGHHGMPGNHMPGQPHPMSPHGQPHPMSPHGMTANTQQGMQTFAMSPAGKQLHHISPQNTHAVKASQGVSPQNMHSNVSPQSMTQGMSPQAVPRGMSPQAVPRGMSPQAVPHGMSPQAVPHGMSPQGMSPQSTVSLQSPQNVPPGMSPQTSMPPGMSPQTSMPPGISPQTSMPPGMSLQSMGVGMVSQPQMFSPPGMSPSAHSSPLGTPTGHPSPLPGSASGNQSSPLMSPVGPGAGHRHQTPHKPMQGMPSQASRMQMSQGQTMAASSPSANLPASSQQGLMRSMPQPISSSPGMVLSMSPQQALPTARSMPSMPPQQQQPSAQQPRMPAQQIASMPAAGTSSQPSPGLSHVEPAPGQSPLSPNYPNIPLRHPAPNQPPRYPVTAAGGMNTAGGNRMLFPPSIAAVSQPSQQMALGRDKPMLLGEQPLLLEDLLEQERREQQEQAAQQAYLQKQQQNSPLLTDADFNKLRVDVLGPDTNPLPLAPPPPPSHPRRPGPGSFSNFPGTSPNSVRMHRPVEAQSRMPFSPDGNHSNPGWPQGGPFPPGNRDNISPHGYPPPPGFPRQPGPQLSPRTPSPFPSQSTVTGTPLPGVTSPALQSPGHQQSPSSMPNTSPVSMTPSQQPLQPPGPGGDGMTDAERQQQLQYEEWLMQQSHLLGMQVKFLEQQIAKQRKTKKLLAGRQRQAKKIGGELSEAEAKELERASQETSMIQKQLDQFRKQSKQHQSLVQEYRLKQQEKYGANWPQLKSPMRLPGAPASMMSQPSPTGQPRVPAPPAGPVPPGPPRMPGSAQQMRMSNTARQEYEQYMQKRLQMMNQQRSPNFVPGMRTEFSCQPPPPAMLAPPPSNVTTTDMDDNNPFSETYQQREQLEKQRQQEQQRLQLQQQIEQQRVLQRMEHVDDVTPHGDGQMASFTPSQQEVGPRFPQFPPEGFSPVHTPPTPSHPPPRYPGDSAQRFTGPRLPVEQGQSRFPGDRVRFPMDMPRMLGVDGVKTEAGAVNTQTVFSSFSPQPPPPQPQQPAEQNRMMFDAQSGFPIPSNFTGPDVFPPNPQTEEKPKKKPRRQRKKAGKKGEPQDLVPPLPPVALEALGTPVSHLGPTTPQTPGSVPPHPPPPHLLSDTVDSGQKAPTDQMMAQKMDMTLGQHPTQPFEMISALQKLAGMQPQEKGMSQLLQQEGGAVHPFGLPVSTAAAMTQHAAGSLTLSAAPGLPHQSPSVMAANQQMSLQAGDASDHAQQLQRHAESAGGLIAEQLHQSSVGNMSASSASSAAVTMATSSGKGDSKSESGDSETKANQNMLLKQLLATPKQKETLRRTSDEFEEVLLTPEQQRQLAMIESMPLTMEMEIPAEEWSKKTAEEKERIAGMCTEELRRMDFERRRKELEDMQKKTKSGQSQKPRKPKKQKDGEGPVKKRQRKGGAAAAAAAAAGTVAGAVANAAASAGAVNAPAVSQQSPSISTPQKEEPDYIELIMRQLRGMPPVTLQEPEVSINHHAGDESGSMPLNGVNQLRGSCGMSFLDNAIDCYSHFPFTSQMPISSQIPTSPRGGDIAARRRYLSDGTQPFAVMRVPEEVTKQSHDLQQQQRYRLSDQMASNSADDFLRELNAHQRAMSRASNLSMPSPPIIEPHLNVNSRASATPDTIISSSSPECAQEIKKEKDTTQFSCLQPIDKPETSDDGRSCVSPDIPLVCPVPVKALPMKIKEEIKHEKDEDFKEKDKENMAFMGETLKPKLSALSSALGRPLKDMQNQVSVTLTLSATASEDIGGVIAAIADLLKIAVPPSYEISRSPSPDTWKMGIKHKEEAVNIQTLMMKSKSCYCRHCDVVVLNSGIKKKLAELPFLLKEEQDLNGEDEVMFCSMNCYMQFAIINRTLQVETAEMKKESGDLIEHKNTEVVPEKPPITLLPSPSKKSAEQKSSSKNKRRSSSSQDGTPAKPSPPKKWKDIKYKRWIPSLVKEKIYTPPSEEELYELIRKLEIPICPSPLPDDTRKCLLCHRSGDGATDGPGRLLNMDVDKWVHLNCALWSYEVYETLNGALMNVDAAYKRGQTVECVLCHKKGATVGCFKVRCLNVYHVRCAQKEGCTFFQDKTILCPVHAPKTEAENVLTSLTVFRRVYINRDENKQLASIVHHEDRRHRVRVGALVFHNIGQLLPHQLSTGRFHNRDFIYPVGFKTTRYYWSMRYINKRCRFVCSINDSDGWPEFCITVIEKNQEKLVLKSNTAKGVWLQLLEPIEKMRREADMVKMFPTYMSGEEMFGLNEPAIIRVIESLPGVELLKDYNFRYGRSPLIELPPTINPTGCARSEPKLRTHFRRPHTLQTTGSSRSLPSTVTGFTSDINSPYNKQFVHSKSQQYRRLKTECRNNVYLGRSRIQGLGLFAARDLEKHTMVIEYIGEMIRDEVAENREKHYDEQNRGVYMFRISDGTVIDATMSGGPARYINHCCQPNCVAEVVPFEKDSKIIIIANRRIARGEELTYDYKFDIEDDQHKIPCCCGARRCRKWMN